LESPQADESKAAQGEKVANKPKKLHIPLSEYPIQALEEPLQAASPKTPPEFYPQEVKALKVSLQAAPTLKPLDKPMAKSKLQNRMKGKMQLSSLTVAAKDTPSTYRTDDGLRKVEDSMADIAGGAGKVTECVNVVGAREDEFKPVIQHKPNSVWNSGISSELEECIESLSYTLFGLPFSVSIAIPSITDTPLIGISDGFLKISGYSRDEIVGQNCRLLLRGVPKEEISGETREEVPW
jgi:hypothetical protein